MDKRVIDFEEKVYSEENFEGKGFEGMVVGMKETIVGMVHRD